MSKLRPHQPSQPEELAVFPLCTLPLRSERGSCREREHLSEGDPSYLPSNETGSGSSDWGTRQRARQAR
jgi:hypothetical protein